MKLQFKIVFNKAEQNCLLNKLTELYAHIIHKRKVLKQIMQCFHKQINCLVCEMKADKKIITQTVIDAFTLKIKLFDNSFVETAEAIADS